MNLQSAVSTVFITCLFQHGRKYNEEKRGSYSEVIYGILLFVLLLCCEHFNTHMQTHLPLCACIIGGLFPSYDIVLTFLHVLLFFYSHTCPPSLFFLFVCFVFLL